MKRLVPDASRQVCCSNLANALQRLDCLSQKKQASLTKRSNSDISGSGDRNSTMAVPMAVAISAATCLYDFVGGGAYKRKIEKNSNESTSVCIIALYLCNKKLIFCFLIKPESRRHRATPKNTLVVLSLQQQVSYLRYDSCRRTSTCSQRRPSRSLFILCIVQYIMYIIWLV